MPYTLPSEIIQPLIIFLTNRHQHLLLELTKVSQQYQWLQQVIPLPVILLQASTNRHIFLFLYRIVLFRDSKILQDLINVTNLLRVLKQLQQRTITLSLQNTAE